MDGVLDLAWGVGVGWGIESIPVYKKPAKAVLNIAHGKPPPEQLRLTGRKGIKMFYLTTHYHKSKWESNNKYAGEGGGGGGGEICSFQ